VRELDGIHDAGGAVGAAEVTRLGGLARVADVAGHALVRARLPVLAQAAARLGSLQVRNVATVGGNLCNASPCADLAPALLAYDATVRIVGPRGRRDLPLEDFFVANRATRLEPGELLEAVLAPTPAPGAVGRFDKVSRVRVDLALVSLAAVLRVEAGRVAHARFVMGSVAPRPVRLRGVEAHLLGRAPDDAAARAAGALAADEVRPIDDLRATAAYRRHVAAVLVERAVRQLGGAA
jgi:CO/xanthine dehydrogenase FAD-binding subunit